MDQKQSAEHLLKCHNKLVVAGREDMKHFILFYLALADLHLPTCALPLYWPLPNTFSQSFFCLASNSPHQFTAVNWLVRVPHVLCLR
jgi:hypothetical protein